MTEVTKNKNGKEKAKTVARLPRKHIRGFMDFVREQGVVGLAVGLAVGTQASELVKTMVSSLVTPLLDLFVGNGGLTKLTWTVHIGHRTGNFELGVLIETTIRFIAVLAVIYFVVKAFRFERLDKKKES